MVRWERKVQGLVKYNLSNGWREIAIPCPHPELREPSLRYLENLGFEVDIDNPSYSYPTFKCTYLKEL